MRSIAWAGLLFLWCGVSEASDSAPPEIPTTIGNVARVDTPYEVPQKTIGLTADVTWASKYMTDGFKIGGDHPVWQPSLGVSLPSLGVSFLFWSAIQADRGNRVYDELDFFVRSNHDFFKGLPYAVNLHGFADYWIYPTNLEIRDGLGDPLPTENRHGNKLHAGISLPELVPLAGSFLVPSYNAYYWLYWADNRRDRYQGGARHELALQYFHSIPRFIPGATAQYAGLVSTVNYNDGVFGIRPGWSHATAQFATSVYALDCIFSLSLNRQWSYLADVDPEGELWSTLSLTKEL